MKRITTFAAAVVLVTAFAWASVPGVGVSADNDSGVELPIAVGLQNAKQITNDLLLPVDQFKALASPGALCMTKLFYEHDGEVSSAWSDFCFFSSANDFIVMIGIINIIMALD